MAKLTLDYANCLDERIGNHGISPDDLEAAFPPLRELTQKLEHSRGTGMERWRDLPFNPVRREHVDAVRSLAEPLRDEMDNLIVLGIGGSALGNLALQRALNPSTWNLLPREQRRGPRLFILDNVDPLLVSETLRFIKSVDPGLHRTFVNVISKSGETAETASQFIIVRSLLKDALGDDYARHVIATTDPDKGTMRAICAAEGYATLPVPEGVGGRFSVLSPVGLFSAACCGIDIDALLDGAAEMDERCRNEDPAANPAAILGCLLSLFASRGKPLHVLMPYANALESLADWYRQLWAESLGKRVDLEGREVFAGATPIKALGATDQHSQLQLYREGPNDKVIGFVEVERFAEDVPIPSNLDVDALRYLQGASLGRLLNAEKRATEFALVESGRPNYTIRLPRLEAPTVGAFMQLWMVTTAYAGLLMNIDAYDQPAVELGKQATFGLMGRSGSEQWKQQVDGKLSETRFLVRA